MDLPRRPQHGDLVLNNIGRTREGRAVVFDWEDFGVCCLPGLDLFTLELSLNGESTTLRRTGGNSDSTLRFVHQASAEMRLDVGDYFALTRIYALAFRYLKRNYGPSVRERLDRVLQHMSRER